MILNLSNVVIPLATIDPNAAKFLLLGALIVGLGVILRYFKQPYIIAYILAGVLLGEHGLEIITDKEFITHLGDFGLILLLFFIGMEISLPDLLKNWKLASLGTMTQVLFSILFMWLIGSMVQWQMNQIIVLGFIISLSSSAVVIKLIQDEGISSTKIGQDVISVLLMQDVLIVPMLIATTYLGGTSPTVLEMGLQLLGGVLIIALLVWIIKKKTITLPLSKEIEADHELQVFIAMIFCFGFAMITSFFGLSAALGAFVGGIFIHAAQSTNWLHDSLHSFRVIFVALFFVSVGMLIDLQFLQENLKIIALVIIAVYLTNHFINAAVLHYFGDDWRSSFFGGAMLAQVGELSFVLSASAYGTGIISDFEYQLTVIIISLTLLFSPFWIALTKKMVGYDHPKN